MSTHKPPEISSVSSLKTRRYEALDSFRGICAVLVVFFHMRGIDSVSDWTFIRNSDLFVEFFFVLSGFVLAHGYAYRDHLDFRKYFISRVFRIFPLHLFVLFLYILLESGKLIVEQLGLIMLVDPPFSGATALKELIPNMLLVHAWTPLTMHLSFNHPSWSISIEFYMYLIFFLTLMIRLSVLRYLVWFLLSLLAFYLLLAQLPFVLHPASGLSCFFGGALTYSIYRRINVSFQKVRILFVILEFSCLCLVFVVLSNNIKHQQLIASILFCITVFVFAFEQGFIAKLLRHQLFQIIGKLSYSIYLIHALVISVCLLILRLASKFYGGNEFAPLIDGLRYFSLGYGWANNLAMLFVALLVIFISHFTYNLIELKWQRIGKSLL